MFGSLGNFLMGTPEKRENVSTLRPEQEGLYNQLVKAGQQKGVGGAFGQSADYYRNLLSDDSEDYNAFAAPMLRQYQQDILPGLSEQFAGMGAGGLSSSGFMNAQTQGATDLAERLGAIRANLRQAGAQGLQGIGNMGLQNYSQNMVTQPGTEGALSQLAPVIGTGLGAFLGGPAGAAGGNAAGSAIGNWLKGRFGSTNPYQGGNNTPASPQIQSRQPGGIQMPSFLQGTGRGF